MDRKSDAAIELKTFTTELVIPENITIGGSKDKSAPGTEFMKICTII